MPQFYRLFKLSQENVVSLCRAVRIFWRLFVMNSYSNYLNTKYDHINMRLYEQYRTL